jgi:RHS repeat-associated protein
LQPGNDQNVMVVTTYNADNLVLTLTAKNPVTGDQTTRYEYGTTLADSGIARNDLRVAEIYPDAADSADRVTFTYNRQSQKTSKTDQNGTTHGYSYDLLGRATSDAVETLAPGIDDTVLRIDTSYEIHGQPYQITSYADTAGTSIVNQIQRAYNSFQQLATEYQEHNGAVNTGTSLKVQYAYANGSANTVRRIAVIYPNGSTVNYLYNAGDDNALSRISSFNDGSPLVAYTYLGLGSVVEVLYPIPGVLFTLATAGGVNPYAGLDTFGRVIEVLWVRGFGSSSSRSSQSSSSGSPILVNLAYGYDLAGNRTFRQDLVAEAAGAWFDELYDYDEMQRLRKLNRGTLTDGNTAITQPTLHQGWHLDATGNWTNFTNVDQTNSANTLDQQRASNTANEITAINRTVGAPWATPAYDRNGNMSSVPQPAAMSSSYAATWDAWNRLTELASGLTVTQQNVYDGMTRRIQQIASGATRNYFYSDQWQSLEERLGSSTAPDRQFVWGLRYIDDCVLRDRSVSGGTLNERLYALQDANWNTAAICNPFGIVQERYAYTAYCVPLFLSASFTPLNGNNSALAWETLYCGYRYETAVGMYQVRYRWLNAQFGCWLSDDPARQTAIRRDYQYCYSRSTVFTDPSGLVGGFIRFVAPWLQRAVCGTAAHIAITAAIKSDNPQLNVEGNIEIQTIVNFLTDLTIGRVRLRPDILTWPKGYPKSVEYCPVASLYEIKPAGAPTPLAQIYRYIQALSLEGVSVRRGNCNELVDNFGMAEIPGCGGISWRGCDVGDQGVIRYTWYRWDLPEPQEVGAPVPAPAPVPVRVPVPVQVPIAVPVGLPAPAPVPVPQGPGFWGAVGIGVVWLFETAEETAPVWVPLIAL